MAFSYVKKAPRVGVGLLVSFHYEAKGERQGKQGKSTAYAIIAVNSFGKEKLRLAVKKKDWPLLADYITYDLRRDIAVASLTSEGLRPLEVCNCNGRLIPTKPLEQW